MQPFTSASIDELVTFQSKDVQLRAAENIRTYECQFQTELKSYSWDLNLDISGTGL